MSDTFQLTVEERDGFAILRTEGYVNNLGGEKIGEAADALIEKGVKKLVLNFEKSNVVNSIGISILIEVIEKIVDVDGRICFCFLTKTIAKTFNIMGLTQYAEIYDTEAQAIGSI
ncbi:MAG: STAS domain-containing protein [Candidatus Sericytochromatia bacterium]|nr:STAS domain-containing protein [Candidatus Sericytochromatia bacterium]